MYAPKTEKGTHRPLAAIFGCSGTVLNSAERRFFADADPLGFILFARNCLDPDQLRRLIDGLRESVGRFDAPVLIDQEGGRVTRLLPPHWRKPPPFARFVQLALQDSGRAVKAARLNARLIASELYDLGITVNCAPVLDIPQPGADPIISDRAAGDTPERAAMLGLAACEGFLDGGVLPVIKHIPGHGRAAVDSHLSLPEVTASREELDNLDFAPFRDLNHMPWAMTAHVLFQAIDSEAPATTSPTVIRDIIRKAIGFDGLLISDDLSMEALDGDLGKRTLDTLAAGCDVVLHCNGKMAEMADVANACDTMNDAAWTRLARGEAARRLPVPMDITAEKARLDDFLKDLQ